MIFIRVFSRSRIFDKQAGEIEARRLKHREESEQFYRSLPAGVLVGMEACGHYPWFGNPLPDLRARASVGESKPFLRDRNGVTFRVHTLVSTEICLTASCVVRDRMTAGIINAVITGRDTRSELQFP